jgi:hypothetical protein
VNLSQGNFPPHISDREWANYYRSLDEDEDEEFDPSADDGGYSQSDF